MKDESFQDELGDIVTQSGRTASLQQVLDFADAQDRTWHQRWSLTTESKAAMHLRLSIEVNGWNIVDSSFQAVRKELRTLKSDARQKAIVLLHSNGTLSASGTGEEGGRPTGSLKRAAKRHISVGGAPEYRTSRACLWCQQNDLVPSMAEGWQRPEQTSPDYRSCPCCNSVGTAGSSDKKSQVFQEYVACANLRSGAIAETEAKKSPHYLQNQECPL
jgi:hypothetical protein